MKVLNFSTLPIEVRTPEALFGPRACNYPGNEIENETYETLGPVSGARVKKQAQTL